MVDFDVVIIGGGSTACHIATTLSKLGKRVAIIEKRLFLGYEISATRQNYYDGIPIGGGTYTQNLLGEVSSCGVEVIFASQPCGIITDNNNSVCGISFANSFGIMGLNCSAVIDTEGVLFAKEYNGYKTAKLKYSALLMHTSVTEPKSITADGFCSVTLRPDTFKNAAVMEICYEQDITFYEETNLQMLLPTAQNKLIELFKKLEKEIPQLRGSWIDGCFCSEITKLSDNLISRSGINGYYVIKNKACHSTEETVEHFGYIDGIIKEINYYGGSPEYFVSDDFSLPFELCEISKFTSKLPIFSISLPFELVERNYTADVLVAGVGTAGLKSCVALKEENADFMAIEPQFDIGGTHSIGCVCGFWHGYTGGMAEKVKSEIKDDCLQYPQSEVVFRAQYHNKLLGDDRKNILVNSFVCGAITDGGTVKSVVCCDGRGLFIASAKVFVDACEGVLSKFCDAEYFVGDQNDGTTQSYSMWGKTPQNIDSFLKNEYQADYDIYDVDDFDDFTRAVKLGYRDNSPHTVFPMIGVRESRRVVCDKILSMDDIWDRTPWEDTVAVTKTPFDSHGLGSNIYLSMGINNPGGDNPSIGKELRANIPYACYTVKGFDNLLVTSKSFSSTRDANIVCRMNADLLNAGYAVGLAAASSVKSGNVRDIDIKKIHNKLTDTGCLPSWWNEVAEKKPFSELYNLAKSGDKTALRDCYRHSEEQREFLLNEYRKNPEDFYNICFAVWLGETAPANKLTDITLNLFNSAGFERNKDKICYCLSVLCRAKDLDKRKLAKIISLIDAGGTANVDNIPNYKGTPYGLSRVDRWRVPNYNLILCVAKLALIHSDTALINSIDGLLKKEHIGGFYTFGGSAAKGCPTVCHGIAPIFCSVAEIRLAAAGVRCKSEYAKRVVENYLKDDRKILRDLAGKILRGDFEDLEKIIYR